MENEVVEHLDIQPNHQVLEVGFGPGAGLEAALKKVELGSGKVHGVDISEQMVIIKLSSSSWDYRLGDLKFHLQQMARMRFVFVFS